MLGMEKSGMLGMEKSGMLGMEKSGYLEVKLPAKLKSLKWKVWRRRWVVVQRVPELGAGRLRLSLHAGQVGAHGSSTPHRALNLEVSSVTRVKSRTRSYAFCVTAGRRAGTPAELLLAGSSESQSQSWMAALRAFASPDETCRALDIGEIYQDAYVIDGETSQALRLTGHYLLVTSQNALSLHSPRDGRLCHEWRLSHVERYAVQENPGSPEDINRVLQVVSNSSCPSGAGQVSLFLSDAQEVISNIQTSIQRVLARRRAEHVKQVLGGGPARASRASSCHLPLQASGGQLGEGVHHWQGSLPCDVEKVTFASSTSSEHLLTGRRGTVSSTNSEDNRKLLKCKEWWAADNQVKPVGSADNQHKPDLSTVPKVPNRCHMGIRAGDNNPCDKPRLNDEAVWNQQEMSISPGAGGREVTTSLRAPSYFRHQSWYSNMTNADAESSSSDDYRKLYAGKSLVQPGSRSYSRFTCPSQTSSFGSLLNTPGVLLRYPQDLHRVRSESSTSNEADDEVDINSDGEGQECAGRLIRQSSANSHLYQELPDVKHCEGHTRCKLCYQRPPTPPQLPPRCTLQALVKTDDARQHPRCMSASISRPYIQNAMGKTPRVRSVSETQHMMRKQHATNQGVVTNMDLHKDMKPIVPSEISKNSLHKVPSEKRGLRQTAPSNIHRDDNYLKPQLQVPCTAKLVEAEDPHRKLSALAGLYQDIDSVQQVEHCQCHTEQARPPEPPPRNNAANSHANQEYYEDLDCFRKNIHKYLGISLVEASCPPPLPHRPLSLPAVAQVSHRKSRLRTLGRKKKSRSTCGEVVSSSQTTDGSVSGGGRPGAAWPHPRPQSPASRISDNSFFSARTHWTSLLAFTDPEEQLCTSFSCGSCGATNTVYANRVAPPGGSPYINPRTQHLQHRHQHLHRAYTQHTHLPDTRHHVDPPETHHHPSLPNTHDHPSLPDTHHNPTLPDTHHQPSLPNTHQHPSLPDTHHHPSLPDTHHHPSLCDTHNHPSLPDTHHHPSLSDTHHHPSLCDTHNHPSLPDTHHHPSLPDTHCHPSLMDTHHHHSLCDTHNHPSLPDTHHHPSLPNTHHHPSLPDTHSPAPPIPFHQLFSPPPPPWSAEDEEWAPRWSVCSSLSELRSMGAPGPQADCRADSDLYTDMSGVAEAMYVPMSAADAAEPVYVNWPIHTA